MTILAKLKDKANSLPVKPGCYLMKNAQDEVIYVGKAKNLKARVSNYFQNSPKTPKTEILVSHIRDFEFLLASSENEAFVLENNLIKKHSPKYNIMMRDDKSYPYIVVDTSHTFPRLQYERRVKRRKSVKLYGPFPTGTRIGEILRTLTKAFSLRDCTDREFSSRSEACLLYQMEQCSAPCVDIISRENYRKDLELALGFLEGKANPGMLELNKRMEQAAREEKFEKAAILRDMIFELEDFLSKTMQKNAEFNTKEANFDVISFYIGEEEIDLSLYVVRNRILLGHKNYHFFRGQFIQDIEEELSSFLLQYYLNSREILPERIVIPSNLEFGVQLEKVIKSESKKEIKVGYSPRFDSILQLTFDNAKETQNVRVKNQESAYFGLKRLKELLKLKELPQRLECYDIAIWQGKSPTASQIVFLEGQADKSLYRHYHLEERPEGNNDFAMIEEVITRRLSKGKLPDVFIIDGGKGQVSSVQKVLKEHNCDIPVCGIAKARNEKEQSTEERLIIPGRANPYILKKNMALMRILVQMRDEAHRFSRRLHHKKEHSRVLSSWLDQIEDIGIKTKQKIRNNLSYSKEELVLMTPEQLMGCLGISKRVANRIWEFFKRSRE